MEKEYLSIRKIMKPYRDKFEVIEVFDVTLGDFFETIQNEKPEIIHFSGYTEKGKIYFCREKDGKAHGVSEEFLAASFNLLPSNVECFFMNTLITKLFAKISSRNTQHAIGADGLIYDHHSISFAMGFYTSLAIEGDYRKAFENGRKTLANFREEEIKGKSKVSTSSKNFSIEYIFYKDGVSYDNDDDTPDSFYNPVPEKPMHEDITDNPFIPNVPYKELDESRGSDNPFEDDLR